MCLIIIKPNNINFPKEEILYKAFKANPDGAGLAYNTNNKVYITKGYMTYNHFIEYYRKIISNISKDSALLIHFRKASRGKVNPELTHPFPITDNLEVLKKTFIKTNYAVAHNGTIKEMDKFLKKNRGLSDTILFIQKYLSLISENENWFTKECNLKLIEFLLGDGRIGIIDSNGCVKTIGQFYEYDGLLFSKQQF